MPIEYGFLYAPAVGNVCFFKLRKKPGNPNLRRRYALDAGKDIFIIMNKGIFSTPLPDISFVGGGVFRVDFQMKDEDGYSFDANGFTASFCISPRRGGKVYYGEAELCGDEYGTLSELRISLPASITKGLCGEYVYQLSLTDEDGGAWEPMQGRMRVAPFISSDSSGRCALTEGN